MVASKAAAYITANRRAATGEFRHGMTDRAGPYLGDTLAMGQAALDLYAATGERQWLTLAAETGHVIDGRFKDPAGGFLTTLQAESTFLKPVKPFDDEDMLDKAVKAIAKRRDNFDKVYGACADARYVIDVEKGEGSLAELVKFVQE